MKLKVLFKIILLMLIVIISVVFYYSFLFEQNKIASSTSKILEQNEVTLNKELTNELTNIEYNSFDSEGNAFYINAEKAIIDNKIDEKSTVRLENVVSIINIKNKGIININSKNAIYDRVNNNTSFYNNVEIDYLQNSIYSQNLDLIFTEKFSRIYNDVIYKNDKLILNTDMMFIDMITGDIKLQMNEKEKKVKLIADNEFIN
tara:strand:+ start:1517 stop:2125 length:609 start_codon:yes stop_codon:yes gene_type:complete